MISQYKYSYSRFAVNVRFIGKDVNKVVQGNKGESLLHIAEKNGIRIPAACEGMGACGTCQVYVNKGMDLLTEITDKENDTLDFAIDVQDNSRLACQAVITSDEGEIEALIPKQSRNIV
ncbi:hypothetical protein M9Y10_041930 [Tritrichomonas musculus]|uniref:2Fe-2S ferredoxin-type domain-containing protein n=1 Tax=Tritrichomonas musculus TaxID=1915356 RepID=A0ABR2K6D1_9EUKA